MATTSRLRPLLQLATQQRRQISFSPRALTSSFESALAPSTNAPPPSLPTSPSPSSTSTFSPPPPVSSDSLLLSTLSRLIMKSGKLPRAHSHLTLCLSTLALSTSSPPLPLLNRALEIVAPSIRLVGRRKGTKVLPTPQPLSDAQRRRQAWLWIVEASEKRTGQEKEFGKRLAAEVLAVLGGQSEAIKKKEARHAQGVTGRANVGR